MTTIPAPTPQPIRPTPYEKGPSRSRKFRWTLPTAPAGARRITLVPKDGETMLLQLHVSHYASSKAFVATLGTLVDTGDSEVWSPLDDVRIDVTPVGRFSVKALEAYTAQVLDSLPGLVDSREDVAALFAPLLAPQADEEVTPQRLDREAEAEAYANSLDRCSNGCVCTDDDEIDLAALQPAFAF